tara:strand:+ start:713 stop:1585 length:873 start_codon:yes stop_codon:yes gene_type:complete
MSIEIIQAQNILDWRKKMLLRGGEEADIDWLLDLGAGLPWLDIKRLYLYPKSKVKIAMSLHQLEKIWTSYLIDNVPLQYLLGKCPWRDFELEVNEAVLIPRQETELLVEFARRKFDNHSRGVWVDLGTGSGALAIALSKSFPLWEGHAVDCSQSALIVAKRNIKRLSANTQIHCHLGIWWEPLHPYFGSIDLVLANPPYIPSQLMDKLDPLVKDNEPYKALCGGMEGLDHSIEILSGAFEALKPGGWIMIEHHYDQSEKLLELMLDSGLGDIGFEKDLNGIKRFAIGRRP